MRFMVIVKANKESEAGVLPSTDDLAAMGKFNEELVKTGVLLAAEEFENIMKGYHDLVEHGRREIYKIEE